MNETREKYEKQSETIRPKNKMPQTQPQKRLRRLPKIIRPQTPRKLFILNASYEPKHSFGPIFRSTLFGLPGLLVSLARQSYRNQKDLTKAMRRKDVKDSRYVSEYVT